MSFHRDQMDAQRLPPTELAPCNRRIRHGKLSHPVGSSSHFLHRRQFVGITKGLDYLHSAKIVHGDIKTVTMDIVLTLSSTLNHGL